MGQGLGVTRGEEGSKGLQRGVASTQWAAKQASLSCVCLELRQAHSGLPELQRVVAMASPVLGCH